MATGFPPMPPLPPRPPTQRRRREKVFVRHPPVINHPPEAWHHTVPYPYKFKIDGPWLFVLGLLVWGVVANSGICLMLGLFIAFMRCVVWLSFRFPLTMRFFVSFIWGLMGRRRW